MFTESEMDTFLDMEKNPFINWSNHGIEQHPTTWQTDDIACAKVLAKLKREIKKTTFKLNHPPLMYSENQRLNYTRYHSTNLLYWNSRLAEASYN